LKNYVLHAGKKRVSKREGEKRAIVLFFMELGSFPKGKKGTSEGGARGELTKRRRGQYQPSFPQIHSLLANAE